MRTTLAVLLFAAVVGTALGGTAALVEFYSDVNLPLLPQGQAATNRNTTGGEAPRAEVFETEYKFGTMQRGTTKSHDFKVRNAGTAPLTLQVGETSCKCTLGVATDKPILPGETVDVHLEWTANAPPGPFRQTARLLTNDPLLSHVTLIIEGDVNAAEGVEPAEFLFDKITAGDTKSAQVYVMSMFEEQLEIKSAELVHEDTRKLFDLKIQPVSRDELPNEKAKAGVRLTLTVKPGLPMGIFSQRVALQTSLPTAEKLEIPVFGRVVGDISIHGNSWIDDRSTLRIGSVKSSVGKRGSLNLVVRGAGAADVTFTVISTDPPELKATLGAANRRGDTLVNVPLEIEVPAGTPPMVRLGTDQGKEGRVIVGTTHPTIKELSIGVEFSVER